MRTPINGPVDDPIVERIMLLLAEQKKTQKDLVQHLGLGNAAFTRWRYQNGKSYMNYINDIADFLGVTPNYLIRGIDDDANLETLSSTEIELIKNYRKMSTEGQQVIVANAKLLAER